MNGEIEAVHDALLQITTRLKHHCFRDSYPSVNYPSNSPFLDQLPPFPPYLGRRGLSPPRMYSDLGHPHPHAGFPLDDRPPFLNSIHRPGLPPHISERKPWGPQVLDYYFSFGTNFGLKYCLCSISACLLNHCQTLGLDVEVSIGKIKIEMDEGGKSDLYLIKHNSFFKCR